MMLYIVYLIHELLDITCAYLCSNVPFDYHLESFKLLLSKNVGNMLDLLSEKGLMVISNCWELDVLFHPLNYQHLQLIRQSLQLPGF